jgi:hypothetical protein
MTVDVFIFPSEGLKNIQRGIDAGTWAVPEAKDAKTAEALATKAYVMQPESRGVLYCSGDGTPGDSYFTTPFLTKSYPDVHAIEREIWKPEGYIHPFKFEPCGSTDKKLFKYYVPEFFKKSIGSAAPMWNRVLQISGLTYFVASKVAEEDWNKLVNWSKDPNMQPC